MAFCTHQRRRNPLSDLAVLVLSFRVETVNTMVLAGLVIALG